MVESNPIVLDGKVDESAFLPQSHIDSARSSMAGSVVQSLTSDLVGKQLSNVRRLDWGEVQVNAHRTCALELAR